MRSKKLTIPIIIIAAAAAAAAGLVYWLILLKGQYKNYKPIVLNNIKFTNEDTPMKILADLPSTDESRELNATSQKKIFAAVTGIEMPRESSQLHGSYRNIISKDKEPQGGGATSFLLPQEIADQLFEKMSVTWRKEVTPDERVMFSDVSSEATKINFGHEGRSIMIVKDEHIDSYAVLKYNTEKKEMTLSFQYGNH